MVMLQVLCLTSCKKGLKKEEITDEARTRGKADVETATVEFSMNTLELFMMQWIELTVIERYKVTNGRLSQDSTVVTILYQVKLQLCLQNGTVKYQY